MDESIDLSKEPCILFLPVAGRLAQLARALPSHGRGRRFESYIAHFGRVHSIPPQTHSDPLERPVEASSQGVVSCHCDVGFVTGFATRCNEGSLFLVNPSQPRPPITKGGHLYSVKD